MSEGAIWVAVSDRPIDVCDLMRGVEDSGHGAQTLFCGVVRNSNLGKKVLAVSYDAFGPLAEKTFRDICEEAQLKWGNSLRAVVMHRTGKLQVGEISVGIAVGWRWMRPNSKPVASSAIRVPPRRFFH